MDGCAATVVATLADFAVADRRRVFGDGIESQPSVHCGLIINHQCLLRNKRCLLAYLFVESPSFNSAHSHSLLHFLFSL